MHDKLNSLRRSLSAITRFDIVVYALFSLSYVALLLGAAKVQWWDRFYCVAISCNTTNNPIVVSGNVDNSIHRNEFLIYDKDLNLKRTILRYNDYSFGQHAISSNGRYLLSLVDSSGDVSFEVISLDTNDPPYHVRVSNPTSYSHESGKHYVPSISLLGDPLSHIAFGISDEVFLIDLTGKVVSRVPGRLLSIDTASQKYLLAYENQRGTDNFYVNCYEFLHNGLQLIYRGPPIKMSRRYDRPAVNSQGILAVQRDYDIQLTDLKEANKSIAERTIPRNALEGDLLAISDSGRVLLMGKHNTNLTAVSALDGRVLGRKKVDGPIDKFALLSDHSLIYRAWFDEDRSGLIQWDWEHSTTKEELFADVPSPMNSAIDLYGFGVLLVWALFFFYLAARKRDLAFGVLVIYGLLSVFMYWSLLEKSWETLSIVNAFQSLTILVFWQILLSITWVWALRYASFPVAGFAILILASLAGHIIQTRSEGINPLPVSMLAIFGYGMVFGHLLISFGVRKRLNLSLAGVLMLVAAIAISLSFFLTSRLGSRNEITDIMPFNGAGAIINNIQFIASVIGGVTHIVFTLLAGVLSKTSSRWIYAIPFALLAGLLLVSTKFESLLFNPFWSSLYIGVVVMSFFGFLLTLLLLNLVYRFLERPLETPTPSTPVLSLPT